MKFAHALAAGLLFVLLLLTGAIYWSGLSGGFAFDDHTNIVDNAALELFDGSFSSLIDASSTGTASPLGRPLSMASFAIDRYFWGYQPFYFKLVNLLIHLVNGLLVYLLVRQIWPLLLRDNRAQYGALWVSAIWLLHPINLMPVLFVVQRMTSLAAFFTLASLCLYLYGRQASGARRWASLALSLLVFWPTGILAKETALLLPLFILLCEWLVLGGFRAYSPLRRRTGITLLVLLAAGVLIADWAFISSTYLNRDFTLGERLLTETRVLWFYLMQMLLPWPDFFSLHHDDFVISHGLLAPPQTALAILAWIVLAGFAFHQRQQRPWLMFALAWFLAGQALESSFLGLEIAYEHRNYVPSIGIFLGLGVWILPHPSIESGRVPRIVLALCLFILCGLITGLRAAQWGDEYIRTQIEAKTHPDSTRTNYEAALAIVDKTLAKGNMSLMAYQMAHYHFQRAAVLDPHNKAALMGMLYLDCANGLKKDISVQQAFFQRMATTRFPPNDAGFIQSLSDMLVNNLLCMNEREVDVLLTGALANPQADGRARGMLHAVAMDYAAAKLGSLPKALAHAQAAVESDPGSVSLNINLIRLLVRLNRIDSAKHQYAVLKGLRIPPLDRDEVENLGLGLGR